eukprot:c47289_g1_i1.p1 GENE.c47289_g1_i1~~c47289_g1_i1.p1  ORF type:complete len:216 (-),score=66.27 c47289_g1_i1:72-677(-)
MAGTVGDDEVIIRKRLLFEGGKPLRTLCANVLKLTRTVLDNDMTDDEWERTLTATRLEIDKFGDIQRRARFILSRNEREISDSRTLQTSIEQQIAESEALIESLKVQLVEEERQRQHKEECQRLVDLINAHPPRAQLQDEISALHNEIEVLDQRQSHLQLQTSLRKKQFGLVIQAIRSLEAELDDEAGGEANNNSDGEMRD